MKILTSNPLILAKFHRICIYCDAVKYIHKYQRYTLYLIGKICIKYRKIRYMAGHNAGVVCLDGVKYVALSAIRIFEGAEMPRMQLQNCNCAKVFHLNADITIHKKLRFISCRYCTFGNSTVPDNITLCIEHPVIS